MRAGTYNNPSFLRRGNHFIRIGGEDLRDRWVLIDGPWFDYLEALRGDDGWLPIRLAYTDLPSVSLEFGSIPMAAPYEEVEWEPMIYHPGFCIHPQMPKLRAFYGSKWNMILNRRTRIGYFLRPDGDLPAFLNKKEMPKDACWADELIRLGN